jgi:hypothetical protein
MRNDTESPGCGKPGQGELWGTSNPRDTRIQIYISIALGVSAFLGFCVSPIAVQTHAGY